MQVNWIQKKNNANIINKIDLENSIDHNDKNYLEENIITESSN